MTAAVRAAVPSAVPIVVGKPQPFLIEQALAYPGTNRRETVMVSDQVGTDIAADNAASQPGRDARRFHATPSRVRLPQP